MDPRFMQLVDSMILWIATACSAISTRFSAVVPMRSWSVLDGGIWVLRLAPVCTGFAASSLASIGAFDGVDMADLSVLKDGRELGPCVDVLTVSSDAFALRDTQSATMLLSDSGRTFSNWCADVA
jgi:hypothetical protein